MPRPDSTEEHLSSDAANSASLEPQAPQAELTIESVKEGQDVADRLVERFPGQVDSLAVLAQGYTLAGKNDKAEATWKKCLELDSRSAIAYFGLGSIAFEKGDHVTAAELARKAVTLNPSLPKANSFLGSALLSAGELQEAVEVLEKVVRDEPQSVTALFLLGEAHLQSSEFDKAIRCLERAIARCRPNTRRPTTASRWPRPGLGKKARPANTWRSSEPSRHKTRLRSAPN